MQDHLLRIYEQFLLPWGLKLSGTLLIFLLGMWAARRVSNLVGRGLTSAKANPALVSFGKNVTYYALLLMVAIAALNKLGVETTPFVALVGASGLAVGLALQGALSNFAAGVMILSLRPFKIGSEIEIAGVVGTVQEIQMFSTIMETADGKTVIVPNGKITADKIVINKKYSPKDY